MYRSTILFIALRYILGKSVDQFGRYIYWISSFAIMLGVMAMIIILSVMNGFERELKKNLLNFIPHVLLTSSKGYVHVGHKPHLMLRQLDNITRVQPLVISNVILQSCKKISFGVMLGIDPNQFEPLCDYLVNKRASKLILGKYYIILGSALAKKLEVHINDQIRLIIPSVVQITPIGYVPSQRLFTVLDIYITSSEVDSYQVLTHQSDASALMHYPPQCVTGWRVWLHKPFLIDNSYYCYQQSQLHIDWVWKDWRESKGSLMQAMKTERNIMFLLLSLIIIAAVFNIISFLVLLILDKQIEIAILQTYGFTRRNIVLLFMLQGISNGFFGVIFGTGLGVLLSNKLNKILLFLKIFSDVLPLPVEIKFSQILSIIFITFIIILLATLYPSWRATAIHPARILRYD
ncbi:lipoprotein-releasing ABC transporter permease subunit LolC [Blochmannia endosymbiont of Camponotus nipponensis]|uniref:lipoprotein-releasing ABC transporter permease subunit LolC n=1 Tax=Blochmannia endosymbiont of Camponotus nipponensis TaxID=2681986 RepID=UPI00135AFE05|nr:lipoprotein-releasing ABC transporter permease subunit LolC [Blochmannia endosymbiont of Camponotus nipponensis]